MVNLYDLDRQSLLQQSSNLILFFKLIATKPTFANVAYKELNKLNK
jgi:hypothetical protein